MTTSMSAIIDTIGSMVTGSVTWIGAATNAVIGSPLLLFFVLVGFVSIGFGLLRRFFA